MVINTPEPPEEVLKDPSIVYRLVDENKVQEGVDNAIKIALEAVKILELEYPKIQLMAPSTLPTTESSKNLINPNAEVTP